MPVHGPLLRIALGLGLVCAAVVAAAGGIALRGPGVVAVCLAGALAGCVAAAVAREAPGPAHRSTLETAGLAAAATVGVLLVISGTAVLAGGAAALMLTGVLMAGWVGSRWYRDRERAAAADAVAPSWPAPSVSGMPVAALGEEWLRTGAALTGRLTPAVRQRVVARRAQVLDELERRDPAGFARWLAAGPLHVGDPAEFVRGDPPHAAPGTETEAA